MVSRHVCRSFSCRTTVKFNVVETSVNNKFTKLIKTKLTCHICIMSGSSVSVYTDTSPLHVYLCTVIHNGHKFCKLLTKRPQTVMFSNYVLKNCEKVYANLGRSASVHTDTD